MTFDLPLHPIVVHFPIALIVLMPVLIGTIMFGIRKFSFPIRTWWIAVAFQTILVFSSFGALLTGERDEKLIGSTMAAEALEAHEELGEMIPWLAFFVLMVVLVPLFSKKKQWMAMTIALLCGLGLIVPTIMAGHTGGKLVYPSASASVSTPTSVDTDD